MSGVKMPPIKLIVGLGNIGKPYVGTRHNVGFQFTDEVPGKNLEASFEPNKRFFGETATATHISGTQFSYCSPRPIMNLSGRAVSAVISFISTSRKRSVVHDELDLPPGSIKYKIGGGCAGHNGLKSISSLIGSQNFQRLRIGIGHPRDKQLQTPVADYVLSRPSPDDRILISQAVAKGIEFLPLIAEEKLKTPCKNQFMTVSKNFSKRLLTGRQKSAMTVQENRALSC